VSTLQGGYPPESPTFAFSAHKEATMMWIWFLIVIVMIVLMIPLLTWARTEQRQPSGPIESDESAQELLEQRYARGEIDREEFEQKKRDLDSNAAGTAGA
jgi:putative membrane protein